MLTIPSATDMQKNKDRAAACVLATHTAHAILHSMCTRCDSQQRARNIRSMPHMKHAERCRLYLLFWSPASTQHYCQRQNQVIPTWRHALHNAEFACRIACVRPAAVLRCCKPLAVRSTSASGRKTSVNHSLQQHYSKIALQPMQCVCNQC